MKPFYELSKRAKVQRLRKLARCEYGNSKNKVIQELLYSYEKCFNKKCFDEEVINQTYEKYIKS